jgi:hypothetical protein
MINSRFRMNCEHPSHAARRRVAQDAPEPREAISVNPGPDLLSNQLDLTSFSLSELRFLRRPELDAAIRRTVEQALCAESGDGIQEQR